MPDFLRTILDHVLTICKRERPFFSFGSLSMYTFALIAEVPVILARFLLTSLIVVVVLTINGNTNSGFGWTQLAFIPTFWSMIALISPIGGAWWWRTRAGGREPSMREQLAYQDAVELLQANAAQPLALPERWFVLDTPQPDAAACGSTLMLSRGLLETDHVPAVLAHELGHLCGPDGRLTAALNRLVIFSSPFGRSGVEGGEHQRPSQPRGHGITRLQEAHKRFVGPTDLDPVIDMMYGYLKILFFLSLFAKGGLGLWLTRPAWGRYWREREYKADAYAAGLGQAQELADFLEIHALIHDRPIPFLALTDTDHPFTELRIDKLRNYALQDQARPLPDSTPSELPATPRDFSDYGQLRGAGL